MKTCYSCREEIQDDAKKCRYCGDKQYSAIGLTIGFILSGLATIYFAYLAYIWW